MSSQVVVLPIHGAPVLDGGREGWRLSCDGQSGPLSEAMGQALFHLANGDLGGAVEAAGKEIERKFSVAGIGALPEGQRIRQWYLLAGPIEVRVRQKKGKWILGLKAGLGAERAEEECELPEGLALALLKGDPPMVDKLRYPVGAWEMDAYCGHLAGLWVAEIELDRKDAPLAPLPSGWRTGTELTGDVRFTNAALAALSAEGAGLLVRLLKPSADKQGQPPSSS
jgi:adenylate cyclase